MKNEEGPLIDFLTSGYRNQWVRFPYGEIYFRKGRRYIPQISEKKFQTLDIANIEFNKKYRGQGHFTRLLPKFEKQAKRFNCEAVYLENVHNERLHDFYIKQGYSKHDLYPDCYWKQVK